MSRASNEKGSPGWMITAQSVSMTASLVAIVVVLFKPISYVSDLRVAVDRLVEATARIDTATRQHEERIRAVEARLVMLADPGVAGSRYPGCPAPAQGR